MVAWKSIANQGCDESAHMAAEPVCGGRVHAHSQFLQLHRTTYVIEPIATCSSSAQGSGWGDQVDSKTGGPLTTTPARAIGISSPSSTPGGLQCSGAELALPYISGLAIMRGLVVADKRDYARRQAPQSFTWITPVELRWVCASGMCCLYGQEHQGAT
jgi:hypothetical protein